MEAERNDANKRSPVEGPWPTARRRQASYFHSNADKPPLIRIHGIAQIVFCFFLLWKHTAPRRAVAIKNFTFASNPIASWCLPEAEYCLFVFVTTSPLELSLRLSLTLNKHFFTCNLNYQTTDNRKTSTRLFSLIRTQPPSGFVCNYEHTRPGKAANLHH